MSDRSAPAPARMAARAAKDGGGPEELASHEEMIVHLRRLLAEKEKELEETKHEFALTMRNTLALQRTRYETQIRELREGRRSRVGLLRPKARG